MKFHFSKLQKDKRGIALFIAVITAGALLLIAVAISDISYKEQVLTISARESKEAFYAADTGLECGLYWDVMHNRFEVSGSQRDITCVGQTVLFTPDSSGGSGSLEAGGEELGVSEVVFDNEGYCFIISVTKWLDEDDLLRTRIISRGYNNCNTGDERRLERALEANY